MLAQRDGIERDYIQPVKQIQPELSAADIVLKVLVRGGDKAYIDGDGLAPADARYFALLQDAQQHALHIQRHLGDLVQKQRSAVGLLEFALRAGTARPGERSADIAEQLAAYEVARDRGTVYGYKGFVPAVGCVMDGVGEKLFSGTALAADKHGAVRCGDALGKLLERAEIVAHADKAVEGIFCAALRRNVALCDRQHTLRGYDEALVRGVPVGICTGHMIFRRADGRKCDHMRRGDDAFAVDAVDHIAELRDNVRERVVYNVVVVGAEELIEDIVHIGHLTGRAEDYQYVLRPHAAVLRPDQTLFCPVVGSEHAGGIDRLRRLDKAEQAHRRRREIFLARHEKDVDISVVLALYGEGIERIRVQRLSVILPADRPYAGRLLHGQCDRVCADQILGHICTETEIDGFQLILQLLIAEPPVYIEVRRDVHQHGFVCRENVRQALIVIRGGFPDKQRVPGNMLLAVVLALL